MITSYNITNTSEYRALFDEATDMLNGFQRVRTYDSGTGKPKPTYYYKADITDLETTIEALEKDLDEGKIESMADGLRAAMYVALDPQPQDVTQFAQKLSVYKTLYIKSEHGAAAGFDPLGGITTLEEYFSWIAELGQMNRKYTVLPLDKECFEINANTRAINIPADYKKNGIAVQGDDLAEVVYFKIDRYFDYMDLNTTDIYIQWETPKGADGKSVKSVSAAYNRDIESEPGKLIFGWAISDKITAAAGNLKFSVRFFKWNTDAENVEAGKRKLDYSFSTLTASIPVQAGLNFDVASHKDNNDVDDCGSRIIARLEDSVIAGGYAAALPEFKTDLAAEYELDENGECQLSVLAISPDTGMISYSWKKVDLNSANEQTIPNEDPIEVYTVYKEIKEKTSDLANITKEEYPQALYVKNGDVYILYPTLPPAESDLANDKFMLYERRSAITVKHSGNPTEAGASGAYYAVARNRITNSVSERDSGVAYFYRPADIHFEAQPKTHILLTDAEKNADGVASIAVTDVKNSKGDSVETYSYQWYRMKGSEKIPDTNSENPNPDGIMPSHPGDSLVGVEGNYKFPNIEKISGATSATYQATQDGYYIAEVTAVRNGAKKVYFSDWCRVTEYPQIPTFAKSDDALETYFKSDFAAGYVPTVKIDAQTQHDDYFVQWFNISVDPANSNQVVSTPVADPERVQPDTLKDGYLYAPLSQSILDKATGLYGGDISGAYYAVVTNRLNCQNITSKKIESLSDNEIYKKNIFTVIFED